MTEEKITIANLKCAGCATTITKELSAIAGVKSAEVIDEEDAVKLSYEGVDRQVIVNKLLSLGYPEATAENGLLLQLKSYASCVLGRMDNLKN